MFTSRVSGNSTLVERLSLYTMKEVTMKVKHVWCDMGNGTTLGHIVQSAHQNADGETKSTVWVDGAAHEMTYREPEDRDSQGGGGTFWNIVDEDGSNEA